MDKKIRLAYIGVGARGITVLRECFLHMNDIEVTVVCDIIPERCETAAKEIEEKTGKRPLTTENWKEAVLCDNVDAVVFMASWHERIEMACFSMEAGKYTAIEVCGAYDISECYKLVEVQERTGTPLMMLENCCYGRREMTALRMVKEGLFGEISHCSGGYCHYLGEFFFNCAPNKESNFRLNSMAVRNCDFYPTHDLGPIAKVLNLNRGNRALRLSSFSSRAIGLKENPNCPSDLKHGDIITTIITCAGGETIRLTLDTTLPRAFYSRDFEVRGTKGMCTESRKVFYLKGMEEGVENNEDEFFEKYDHPLHKEFQEAGPKGGHGGMDWLVCRAFVDSVKYGTPPPIDVYDAALWMSITPLSEMSISKGGAPVDIPDFTNGKWMIPNEGNKTKYSLDNIVEDKSIGVFDNYKE